MDLAETSEVCIDMVKKYPDATAMYWESYGADAKKCHATFEKFETQDDLMLQYDYGGMVYICIFWICSSKEVWVSYTVS